MTAAHSSSNATLHRSWGRAPPSPRASPLPASIAGSSSSGSSARADRRKDELGHQLPLRNEEGRVRIVAAGERDRQVELGDRHEDLSAVSAREDRVHLAIAMRILVGIPEIAVSLAAGTDGT